MSENGPRLQTFDYEPELNPVTLKKLPVNYINPALYLLGSIYDFKNDFIDNTLKFKEELVKNNKFRISFLTSRLYYHLYVNNNNSNIYNADNYLNSLKSLNYLIGKEKNMNINDVLIYILNKLHEEINDNINNNNNEYIAGDNLQEVIKNLEIFNAKNKSIIKQILNYTQIKTYNCNNCQKRFFEIKNYLTYQLNNLDNRILTINDSLDNDKNKNNIKYFCKICNSYQFFNINYKFHALGKKIIFLLDNKTSNNKFKIEEKINLAKYLAKPGNDMIYNLCGIITYNNKEKNYNTFVKCFIDDKWYLFKDEFFEKKNNIDEILNEINKFDNNDRVHISYCLLYSINEDDDN